MVGDHHGWRGLNMAVPQKNRRTHIKRLIGSLSGLFDKLLVSLILFMVQIGIDIITWLCYY